MELHPLHRQFLVAHGHDDAAVGPSRHLQAVREALPLDGQRVVTHSGKRVGQAGQHALPLVVDEGQLAVHDLAGAGHDAAEDLADALVAEADPQDRDLAGEVADDIVADAGLARRFPGGLPDGYAARAAYEIDVICAKGFPSYFLIVADLVNYAGVSGDLNPIHWDDEIAKQVGLDTAIAHGMLTMGLGGGYVTSWVGDPGAVTEYNVRFTAVVPVPNDGVGAEIVFNGRVKSVDTETKSVTIALSATSGGKKIFGRAVAIAKLA